MLPHSPMSGKGRNLAAFHSWSSEQVTTLMLKPGKWSDDRFEVDRKVSCSWSRLTGYSENDQRRVGPAER
jgi:hypothetical protein